MPTHDRQRENDGSDAALAPERPRLEPPRRFKVVLINDDYTPMEFVVEILMEIFALPSVAAVDVMMAVHQKGRGVAGVYTRDIAETKMAQVGEAAKRQQHPLRCILEPE